MVTMDISHYLESLYRKICMKSLDKKSQLHTGVKECSHTVKSLENSHCLKTMQKSCSLKSLDNSHCLETLQ